MQVITQVMVLFLLMALGYIAARWRILDQAAFAGINKAVLYFALPSLTFVKLQQTVDPGQLGELGLTFLLAAAAMLLCGAAGLWLFKREEPGRRSVLLHLSMFSNCGFMGYPLIAAALGEDKIIYAVMYVAAFNFLTWTVGVYLYAGKAGVSLKKALLNPTLIAVLLGMGCFVFSIRLPQAPVSAMEMLGATTTPLSMLVVGSRLSGIRLKEVRDRMVLFTCFLRLAGFPFLIWLVLLLLQVPQPVREAIFVCSAMPGAAATAMQAEYYQVGGPLGSRSVALSTALSVLTIPVMLLLL